MEPVVDRLKSEFEGVVEFRLYNFDRDADAGSVADSIGNIQYVPTFVFMNSAGEQVDLRVGAIDEGDLRAILESLE